MKTFAVLLSMLAGLSFSAQAEVALLCGPDLKVLEDNDDRAVVHVDFDDRIVKSSNDVKFLNTFGREQKVRFAATNGDVIVVRTDDETYLFKGLENSSCDGDDQSSVTVELPDDIKFKCLCFED